MSRPARLEPFLGRHRRIGIDTAPLICHLEGDDKYLGVTTALFTWLQGRAVSAVTSTLTLAELLVQPYRMNDPARVSTALAATSCLAIWNGSPSRSSSLTVPRN